MRKPRRGASSVTDRAREQRERDAIKVAGALLRHEVALVRREADRLADRWLPMGERLAVLKGELVGDVAQAAVGAAECFVAAALHMETLERLLLEVAATAEPVDETIPRRPSR